MVTLLYTLTAPMARFWPKTLPTSDDSSHCLDTGCAPGDLLGKVDVAKATNITELPSPVTVGTASSSVLLTHKGGCCSRQGWGYFGIGRRLLLFSPDEQLYP